MALGNAASGEASPRATAEMATPGYLRSESATSRVTLRGNDAVEELDVAMPQRVRSREVKVESGRLASPQRHMPGEWTAVAGAGGTVLVAAMDTGPWQATRSGVVGLFGRRGLARQAAIGVELDAHAALVSQADNPDEVRQGLVTVWRLELAALLRQHPAAKDPLRTLVVRVWEALPTAQQTWVRTTIAHHQATQYTAQSSCGQIRQDKHPTAGWWRSLPAPVRAEDSVSWRAGV